jgi:hypothetical protein
MSNFEESELTCLACFLALRCFATEDFSILFRSRTGTRFDLGSNDSFRLRTVEKSARHTSDLHVDVEI